MECGVPDAQQDGHVPTPCLGLLAWDETRATLAEAALEDLVARKREAVTVTDLLLRPKRRQRSA